MSKTSKVFTFIAGAVVALVLAVGAGFAFADTPVDDEIVLVAQTENGDGDNGMPQFHRGPGGPRGESPIADYFDKDDALAAVANVLGMSIEELEAAREEGAKLPELAEQQGVDIEDVQAAVKEVRDAAINEALADGVITEEQAEFLLSQEGRPNGRRGGRVNQLRTVLSDYISRDDLKTAAADALDLSVEELEAAREDGTGIAELAEQQDIAIEDVHAAVKAVRDTAIDEAVADGVLTAEQGERLKAREGFGGRRGEPRGGNGNGPNTAPVGNTNNA